MNKQANKAEKGVEKSCKTCGRIVTSKFGIDRNNVCTACRLKAGRDKSKPGLTMKQKIFADTLLETKSKTKAAKKAYAIGERHGITSKAPNAIDQVAQVIARENLSKPTVIQYLEQNGYQAGLKVTELMSKAKAERLQFDAARDILDRTVGKAPEKHLHASISKVEVVNYSDTEPNKD